MFAATVGAHRNKEQEKENAFRQHTEKKRYYNAAYGTHRQL